MTVGSLVLRKIIAWSRNGVTQPVAQDDIVMKTIQNRIGHHAMAVLNPVAAEHRDADAMGNARRQARVWTT
jgi:hypothetical protein